MADISPKSSEDLVLQMINQIIHEQRPISAFEKRRLEDNLASLYRSNIKLYHAVNSGYKCVTCDAEGVRESVDSLRRMGDVDFEMFNMAITSLVNSMLFDDAYEFIKDIDFESDVLYLDKSLISSLLTTLTLNADDDLVRKIVEKIPEGMKSAREIKVAIGVYLTIDSICKANGIEKKKLTKFIRAGMEAFSVSILNKYIGKVFLPVFCVNQSTDEMIKYLNITISYPEGTDIDIVFDSSDKLIDIMSDDRFIDNTDLNIRQIVVFNVDSDVESSSFIEDDELLEIDGYLHSISSSCDAELIINPDIVDFDDDRFGDGDLREHGNVVSLFK